MCGGLSAFLLVVNAAGGAHRAGGRSGLLAVLRCRWWPAVLAPWLPAAVVVAVLAVAAGGQLWSLRRRAIPSDA